MTDRLTPRSMRQRLRALELRASALAGSNNIDFLGGTFPQQRAFIEDPARLKYAICTRRAAKSYSVGLDLMRTAHTQPGTCLYVGLTRESAKRTMWRDVLKTINITHRAGFKFNETSLVAESAIGSPIYLIGLDSNDNEKQKALGQKFRKVYIDEAQAFTIDLEALVYNILKPATVDYLGTIGLVGTPGNITRGFFYDLSTGKKSGWSGHSWSAYNNPFVAQEWDNDIKTLIAANSLVQETPWFRQMYLGEWVIESDKLVYRYNPDRNSYNTIPDYHAGKWNYLLGVDLGWNDPTAFVVCAWHDYDKVLYMLESSKSSQLDITATAEHIRAYQSRFDFDAIVVDGANKQAVEEMRRRHDLPLITADKTGKSDMIEVMNGEFIQGNIKLSAAAGDLADEYMGLIWNDKGVTRQEHPNCPNHLADAALYAWRYCFQYLSDVLPAKKLEEDIIWERERERWKQSKEAEMEAWGIQ